MRTVLSLTLAALICAASAGAATYVVRPDGTGDFPTIQAALDAAVAGDTIALADGVFAGAGNRDLDFLGKGVALRSVSADPARCVLECGGSSAEEHRGFFFHSGEDSTAVVSGVTVRGGWAEIGPSGGAIACVGECSPRFTDCVMRGNVGAGAGAVLCEQYCAPVFTRCAFLDNRGSAGAALFVNACRPRFEDCVFLDNTGTHIAGALHFLAFVEATLTGCTFAGNTCPITGTVYAGKMSTTVIDRCTFWGNQAHSGAAVKSDSDCPLRVSRTLIAFNAAGPAIESEYAPVDLDCCDLYGNAGGDWVGGIAGLLGQNGNISEDPLLCDPASGDFTVRDDSPCAPGAECDGIGAWPVGCGASQACDPALDAGGRWLGPVGPDPAAGPVTIRCALPAGAAAALDILDAAGRVVRALAVAPGGVTWDRADDRGRPLATGVYFVRLRAGGRVEMRPLLVVR